MEKEQLQFQKRFTELYQEITESQDVTKMEVLGDMTKRVFSWLVMNEPRVAEKAIDILEEGLNGKFRNELTEEEARDIVDGMDPKPSWDMNSLNSTLTQMNLRTEEPPYYNRWALLTTMLMIQSDSGETLSRLMNTGKSSERMVNIIYQLALDRLKDLDGKFNIRKYFNLPE